jgi:hypothetical protein
MGVDKLGKKCRKHAADEKSRGLNLALEKPEGTSVLGYLVTHVRIAFKLNFKKYLHTVMAPTNAYTYTNIGFIHTVKSYMSRPTMWLSSGIKNTEVRWPHLWLKLVGVHCVYKTTFSVHVCN